MAAKRPSAKDLDGLCAQLQAQVQLMDGQLRSLKAEHEALRRCLDRAGVLPARELEGELQRSLAGKDGAAKPELQKSGASPSTPPGSPSAPSAARRSQGPAAASSEDAVEAARPAATPRPRSLPRANTEPRLPPQRSRSSRGLGEDATAAQPERRPEARASVATTPHRAAQAEAEAIDLFECLSKLLDAETSALEQQKAMKQLQQAMKNPAEPPNAWSGPGVPLSAVVKAGRVDLARILLRARADPNQRDVKGVTPLHLATFDGNFELCRVLLVARSEVDSCDRHGQTPLFFAPTREICKLLVERRSDVTLLNRKGQSALHLAGRAGLHDVLDWFTGRVNKSLVELRDIHGATARSYIMQSGVPKPETPAAGSRSPRNTSPRASRGRQSLPAPAAPVVQRRPGGSTTNHLQAAGREDAAPAAPAEEPQVDGGGRRNSLLPSVSELVAGSPGTAASCGGIAATATPADKVSCADESPSKRAAEHFQICDALDTEEPEALQDEGHPLSPTCEEMFDGLGPEFSHAQANEALAAAVGVATAAVATAVELDAAAAHAAAQASGGGANDAPEPDAVGEEERFATHAQDFLEDMESF